MFEFIHSILGSDNTGGNYPGALVKIAIERAVDGTDPWIRAVSGYKRKLRPAVVRAIDHVVALVDGMATPVVVEHGSYDKNPLLRTFFISSADMRKILASDRTLADFRHRQETPLPRVIAMLAMEKQEKTIFGAELSGSIMQLGVPQVTVSFEAHHLLDPAANEDKTRRLLKRRAFDHLLSLALKRITAVKTERDELERYRELLQSKLNVLRRGGWGFDKVIDNEHPDAAGVEEVLAQVETQMLELGGDDAMLELYLGIVIDVLGRPEEHLWARKESLVIDHMGIKRNKADSNIPEVTLDIISNDDGLDLVISMVAISEDLIQNDGPV